MSGAAIILACPFLLAMLKVSFPWAWVMMFLACFFLFFNTGPTNAILANVTHPSIRATAFAVNILVIHLLGDAAAPPVLGGLAGRFGWNAAFGLVAAAMTLAGVLWLFGDEIPAAQHGTCGNQAQWPAIRPSVTPAQG